MQGRRFPRMPGISTGPSDRTTCAPGAWVLPAPEGSEALRPRLTTGAFLRQSPSFALTFS